MNARYLASNLAWSLLSHLLSRGSILLAAILLARHFNTKEFAAYNYFLLTVSMLAMYAAMGLGVAASKFFAEHVRRGDGDHDSKEPVLGLLCIGAVLVSLVAFVLVLLLPSDWIDAGFDLPRWLLATGVLITSLQVVPAGAVLGLEEYRRASVVSLSAAAAMLTGAGASVVLDNIQLAIASLLAASIVQLLGESAVVVKRVGWSVLSIKAPVAWRRIWRILDVSLPMAANGIIVASSSWLLGRIILAGPGGEHAFALFAIGMQWFALAMFLPGNMSRVFLPRFVEQAVAGNGECGRRTFLRKAVLATFVASIIVAVASVAISPFALGMYGNEYQVAPWLIAAYMGAATVSAPVTTLGNALLAHGAHWKRLGLMLMWAAVLLLSAYGTRDAVEYGGAMVIALAYGCLTVAMLLVLRKMKMV